jgi:hypothetical protein
MKIYNNVKLNTDVKESVEDDLDEDFITFDEADEVTESTEVDE